MPYVQVLAMKNSFAYIGFLPDGRHPQARCCRQRGWQWRKTACSPYHEDCNSLSFLLFEQAESVVAIQHIAHCGSGQVAAFYQYGTMIAVCQFASRLFHILHICDSACKQQ